MARLGVALVAIVLSSSVARAQMPALERYSICDARGGAWTFCRGDRRVRENRFIRDYRSLTHRPDLDQALKMRNVGALKSFGIVAAAGVTVALATIPLSNFLGPGDGLAIAIPVALWATAGIAFVGGTMGFVIAALLPDGTTRNHLLRESEAAEAVDRYNAAMPVSRVRVVPYAGPNGVGFAGTF